MDWQKRSEIKMAELSGDLDKIIKAYSPLTIYSIMKTVNVMAYTLLPPLWNEVLVGIRVENYLGKEVVYFLDDGFCRKVE